MKSILYIGNSLPSSTSKHRANAIARLGHTVIVADPYIAMGRQLSSIYGAIHFRSGYRMLQNQMAKWTRATLEANGGGVDLVWIDSGELLGRTCVQMIREKGISSVFYNIDDVTGVRDGRRFDSVRKAMHLFDHCVVCREPTYREYVEAGCPSVQLVPRSYDEIEHAPFPNNQDIPKEFLSDVAFIGTWMRNEKRDEFLIDLIDRGVPLSIWGARWEKSKHWNRIKPFFRGGSLSGRNYVAAVQGAKICLGLLSRGNRDQTTTRSIEIPFANGLLCAQRTSEHLHMYKENHEAVFWEDSEECADVCIRLLQDDVARERIRLNGRKRVLEMKVGNESVCKEILSRIIR